MTVNHQSNLNSIIKRKAVGPHGSRHLNKEDVQTIIPAMKAEGVNLAGKAVLVTSLIILDQNELEKRLVKQWKSGEQFLPDKLRRLFFEEAGLGFHFILKKILKNEDLNADEALTGIDCLLHPDISDYEKGVFLIGERLKRETFEENYAFLQTLRNKSNSYSQYSVQIFYVIYSFN